MKIRLFRNLAPEGLGGLIAIMFGGGRETISPSAIDDDTLPAAFRSHFAHFIAAKIRELERRRLRTLKALLLRLWLYPFFVMPLCVVAAYLVVMSSNQGRLLYFTLQTIGMMICISGFFGAWFSVLTPLENYRNSIKSEIFSLIFRYFGQDFSYERPESFSVEHLLDSQIVPEFSNGRYDDYVRGVRENLCLEIVEAHLERSVGTRRASRDITVFRGLFSRIEMEEAFGHHTIVVEDAGGVFRWFDDKLAGPERLHIED